MPDRALPMQYNLEKVSNILSSLVFFFAGIGFTS
jgi:hypothetical protein